MGISAVEKRWNELQAEWDRLTDLKLPPVRVIARTTPSHSPISIKQSNPSKTEVPRVIPEQPAQRQVKVISVNSEKLPLTESQGIPALALPTQPSAALGPAETRRQSTAQPIILLKGEQRKDVEPVLEIPQDVAMDTQRQDAEPGPTPPANPIATQRQRSISVSPQTEAKSGIPVLVLPKGPMGSLESQGKVAVKTQGKETRTVLEKHSPNSTLRKEDSIPIETERQDVSPQDTLVIEEKEIPALVLATEVSTQRQGVVQAMIRQREAGPGSLLSAIETERQSTASRRAGTIVMSPKSQSNVSRRLSLMETPVQEDSGAVSTVKEFSVPGTPKLGEERLNLPSPQAQLDNLATPLVPSTPRSEGLGGSKAKQEFHKKISQKVGGKFQGLQKSIQVRQQREKLWEPRITTQVIGGTCLMRLDENGIGKQCLVGVGKGSAGTLWWEHRDEVTVTNLSDIIVIEYGIDSRCFSSLQQSLNPTFRNVLPWDCFSVFFKNGDKIDFFQDRKRTALVRTSPSSGKRSLVTNFTTAAVQDEEPLTPSPDRLVDVDSDIELFLLGLSLLYKKHLHRHLVRGMTISLTQLRFRRAIMKIAYLRYIRGEHTKSLSSKKIAETLTQPSEKAILALLPIDQTAKLDNAIALTEEHRAEVIREVDVHKGESPPLKQARANLKTWGVLPDDMSPLVRRKFEAIQQTLQVRKHREDLLYAIVERQVLGGTYFLKLDEGLKTYPCLVGIGGDESVTFWWEHLGQVTPIPLTQIVHVEWGLESKCYKLLQKAKSGDLLNVLPWNCFTVSFTGNREANFFADRRGRSFVKIDKTGKRHLLSNRSTDTFKRDPIIIESAMRLGEVSDEIEKFLFGFAVLFRQERSQRAALRSIRFVPGLPVSLTQLRMRRAIMKMQYINKLTADDLEEVVEGV